MPGTVVGLQFQEHLCVSIVINSGRSLLLGTLIGILP